MTKPANPVSLRQVAEEAPEEIANIARAAMGLPPRLGGHAGRRLIIGFTGAIAVGKSTAAFQLVRDHGFERIRFAGALKAMMKAIGLSSRELEGDLKEQPCALLGGKTPRYAMQTLGTEWGRDLIAPDLWVGLWRAGVDATTRSIVVDDVRFPNEVAALRAAGGVVVKIVRAAEAAASSAHVSESYAIKPDIEVRNEGSKADFHASIACLHNRLRWS